MRPSDFYRRFSSWPLGPWYLQTTMTRLCVPSSVDEIPERFVVQIKMFASMRCLKFWHHAHQDSSRVFLWFLHQFFHGDHFGDVKARTQTSNFCDSRGQGQRCRGREICQGETVWIYETHISLDDYHWRSSFSRLKLTQLRAMLNNSSEWKNAESGCWLVVTVFSTPKVFAWMDLSESVKQWEALEQHPATPENVAKFQWWAPSKFLDLAIMQIVIVKAGKSSDAFNGIVPWMKSTLECWSCKHTICLDCADCC